MGQRFIMTAFGKDRPGIVADVTGILYENGCNLEDTSMTLMAGEFTLILLFTAGSADVADPLSRDCRRLEQEKGISAFLRPLEREVVRCAPVAGHPVQNILAVRIMLESVQFAHPRLWYLVHRPTSTAVMGVHSLSRFQYWTQT